MRRFYDQARAVPLTGDPDQDWRAMRRLLGDGTCARLRDVAEEARNLRLLDRGTQLRQELAQDWRDNGSYANALAITQRAFVREHFGTSAKPETGVVVMNMRKAKGKQFDEVIIFEGWPRFQKRKIVANYDRIVRRNARDEIDDQARQNFVSARGGQARCALLERQRRSGCSDRHLVGTGWLRHFETTMWANTPAPARPRAIG
jgi:DNA helicase-2/ATP-dependent DNA helicase PcrA